MQLDQSPICQKQPKCPTQLCKGVGFVLLQSSSSPPWDSINNQPCFFSKKKKYIYIYTVQEINISHLGKRKIIFKYALSGGYVHSLEGIYIPNKYPLYKVYHIQGWLLRALDPEGTIIFPMKQAVDWHGSTWGWHFSRKKSRRNVIDLSSARVKFIEITGGRGKWCLPKKYIWCMAILPRNNPWWFPKPVINA